MNQGGRGGQRQGLSARDRLCDPRLGTTSDIPECWNRENTLRLISCQSPRCVSTAVTSVQHQFGSAVSQSAAPAETDEVNGEEKSCCEHINILSKLLQQNDVEWHFAFKRTCHPESDMSGRV
ncbi:hypothetical protein F2P81_016315 [Scophthalmus maximus]|uniref:Uncharacterized protein n=1 Tax=Scophthalmus maximus TaxID=52904 RepID=A0A6A4SIN6_SCOMX|nr:hypothetical protein F2P81_016315 [Scophthalmus maximus]